ncbi:hypothetical protein, partial [Enterococcus faecalis]|uniref:hypothetical protein n=1 Tax=Enterococcus faecalis TaxID=1351 RepID=UPI0039855396
VGSNDGETISIKIDSAAGWNLASGDKTAGTSAPVTSGAYVNTVAKGDLAKVGTEDRSVEAVGFDVISGRVSVDKVGGGSP